MFIARLAAAIAVTLALAVPARAGDDARARAAIDGWYALVLELVRHTATYSPPVAARSFGYLGVTAWEATAATDPSLISLAGQLTAFTPPPAPASGAGHDPAVTLEAALGAAIPVLFANTGPTGQRAMAAMGERLATAAAAGVDPATAARSVALGQAIAAHVLSWAETDGGHVIENMGFPQTWPAPDAPSDWVPTSLIRLQQAPLLPDWGNNRPFAMPAGDACALPPPPAFSTDPASAFHAEAMATYAAVRDLTPEQEAIARFWSDDPMLSPTPPGHWIVIARIALDQTDADAVTRADTLARLGIALADAFIGCWQSKYEFDLLRPVTYIRAHIDPAFAPILITPPFPEYPSGHSTQSGAAAEVLTALFGEPFAFTDTTHEDDGLGTRSFDSFRQAAEEAGISRLYGGIHFPAAITRGLEQGVCIATHTNALVTRP
jgi:membrane-associated phospholipid phosphatase